MADLSVYESVSLAERTSCKGAALVDDMAYKISMVRKASAIDTQRLSEYVSDGLTCLLPQF